MAHRETGTDEIFRYPNLTQGIGYREAIGVATRPIRSVKFTPRLLTEHRG